MPASSLWSLQSTRRVPILRQLGFRRVIFGAGLLAAASGAACCLIVPSMPILLIGAILLVHGAVRSVQLSAINSIAFSDIDSSEMSRSNSFLSAIMQLCSGVGVAVASLSLRAFTTASGGGSGPPSLHAFHMAILISSLLTLGPVFAARKLSHDAGALILHPKRDAVGVPVKQQ